MSFTVDSHIHSLSSAWSEYLRDRDHERQVVREKSYEVTEETLIDPVVDDCGHTFSRESVDRFDKARAPSGAFLRGQVLCPYSRQIIHLDRLKPIDQLKPKTHEKNTVCINPKKEEYMSVQFQPHSQHSVDMARAWRTDSANQDMLKRVIDDFRAEGQESITQEPGAPVKPSDDKVYTYAGSGSSSSSSVSSTSSTTSTTSTSTTSTQGPVTLESLMEQIRGAREESKGINKKLNLVNFKMGRLNSKIDSVNTKLTNIRIDQRLMNRQITNLVQMNCGDHLIAAFIPCANHMNSVRFKNFTPEEIRIARAIDIPTVEREAAEREVERIEDERIETEWRAENT